MNNKDRARHLLNQLINEPSEAEALLSVELELDRAEERGKKRDLDKSFLWRLSEGMEGGTPVIFIRNSEEVLFRTNLPKHEFTGEWYKRTRAYGQAVCDALNSTISSSEAFGEFRKEVRAILHGAGVSSNPGWTDQDILAWLKHKVLGHKQPTIVPNNACKHCLRNETHRPDCPHRAFGAEVKNSKDKKKA